MGISAKVLARTGTRRQYFLRNIKLNFLSRAIRSGGITQAQILDTCAGAIANRLMSSFVYRKPPTRKVYDIVEHSDSSLV